MILVVLQQSLSKLIFFFPTSPGIVSEKGMREEVPPVLQYQILQLALDLPASKFSWFRIQVKKLHCRSYFAILDLHFARLLFRRRCFVISIVSNVDLFSSQDAADTESSSGEKSVLYLLLKMFVSSGSSHLKTSTRRLVLKVRNISFFFSLYTFAFSLHYVRHRYM